MPRNCARPAKRRSQGQLDSLTKAWGARDRHFSNNNNKENIPPPPDTLENQALRKSVNFYKERAKSENKRYWNEHQKNNRLQEANESRKLKLGKVVKEAVQLRGELDRKEKELLQLNNTAGHAIEGLQTQLQDVRQSRRDLHHKHNIIARKCARAINAKDQLKKHITSKAKNTPTLFRLAQKSIYTTQARSLATYMVSTGMAEGKVGVAIKKIGGILGVKVDRVMDKRTVQRAIKESGVAADIQAVYEMSQTNSMLPHY